MSKRRTLVYVLPAYTKFFCWLLMHICILIAISLAYTRCAHWVSNCNSQAKCIHAWVDNNRICIEEVPKLVYTFWICKPVAKCYWHQRKTNPPREVDFSQISSFWAALIFESEKKSVCNWELASCQWGPATDNGGSLLTEIWAISRSTPPPPRTNT